MAESLSLALEGASDTYVEVAVPVPLRRVFSYTWPAQWPAVAVGTRVAVPFHGRKMVGVVVGHRETLPEGVKRAKKVAGVLDDHPIFHEELLLFLREAAAYYMHPLGEVLRAAAPAMSRDAVKALRDKQFLAAGETLKGEAVAIRKELFVRPLDAMPKKRLGAQQMRILALLQEREEVALSELRQVVPAARQVVMRLCERSLVEIEEREVAADPFFTETVARDAPHEPTEAQARAITALCAALEEGASTHLLHGVTGSGKTEVYLRVISEARARGRGALLLVPEIALTPQLVARFRARFGDGIAVLHSGLTSKQRFAAWRGLREGSLDLAIGARSALFAPVPNLGVVVVDEEHDGSFKQEETFRYHARDLAILRAHRAGAVCILGSATPSLESMHRARQGHYQLHVLPKRATSQSLPEIEVLDLRRLKSGPTDHPLISGPLYRAIETCLRDDGQAVLFLNRRGFSPSLRCGACGEVLSCPACAVSLTEHRRERQLRCHYCDFSMPYTATCRECGANALAPMGLGTERLEQTLSDAFAPAKVARLDRDTAVGGRAIESVLTRFRRREIDVLVGTQMVTKGHDLPGVTLVGVILADQALAFPDFRAAERTYQLLSQVAGRAGRGDRPGRVLFQTFQPEHSVIRSAEHHDYESFFQTELGNREELLYPPFAHLAAVRVNAGDEGKAREATGMLAREAKAHPLTRDGQVSVLGPAPAPIERLRGRFRFRLLLRSKSRKALRKVCHNLVLRVEEGLGPVRAQVDFDPVSML